MKRRLFTVYAFLLAGVLLAPLLPGLARPSLAQGHGTTSPLVAPAVPNAAQPIQALYIYNQDSATAQSITALLGANGVTVTPLALNVHLDHHIFLPLVRTGLPGAPPAHSGAPPAAAQQSAATVANPGLYDVIVVADDSSVGGNWLGNDQLFQGIIASGRPVLGLGLGGAAFFDRANLHIGFRNTTQSSSHQIEPVDGLSSRPFYNGRTPVSTAGSPLNIYSSDQSALSVLLASRSPTITRLARIPGTTDHIPVVREDERWALWGFRGGPGQMTATGQNLLVNLLWLLTGDHVAIPLVAGVLNPSAGVEPDLAAALAGGTPQFAIAQLRRLPTPDDRRTLAGLGVELLEYLADNTFSAQVAPTTNLNDPALLSLIRFLGSYKPAYKVDPQLTVTASGARPEAQTLNEVVVTFFANVPLQTVQDVLKKHAGTSFRKLATDHDWLVPNNAAAIAGFAQEPSVRFIGEGLVPPLDLNDTARAAINTDAVQAAVVPGPGTGNPIVYTGLTGQGVVMGHMEGNAPDTGHTDLIGRVILGGKSTGGTGDHSTHTVGTIVGNGTASEANGAAPFQRRGHAPRATLVHEDGATQWPVSSGAAFTDNFSDAIRSHDAVASSHSYVMNFGAYDGSASGIDTIVRGDATDSSSNPVPARLAIWAAANQGSSIQYGKEQGFYSIYSPAKNALSVGSTDSNNNVVSNFSSKGPTFDGRIKPDVSAPGCRNSGTGSGIISTAQGGGYDAKCGTSMATPATAGVVALMMEQYRHTFGASAMPLPSSIKAVLVNTATDSSATTTWNDPDCTCTYTYGTGPDWSTGYGMINAQAAVNAVRSKAIIEDQVAPGTTTKNYTFDVAAGRPELRFTLAWDDEAGDTSTSATTSKLVNDLDLVLVAPDGTTLNYPWKLDALPEGTHPSTGSGADPISQNDINNNPAYRGANHKDNVEQVVVPTPAAGTWTARVTAFALPNAHAQKFSLTGDVRRLNIVAPKTGHVAEAGDPAAPNNFLVALEAEQPYAADVHSSLVDAQAGDFSVVLDGGGVAGGTAADVVSGTPVGDQFWLTVHPHAGVYTAGHKYNLTVKWSGHGQDTENQSVLFTDREITDRAIVIDHSGSMADYDKMNAAKNAARLFIDQSLVGDRVAVVGFDSAASTPMGITIVSSSAGQPELNAAKTAVNGMTPTTATALGQGLLQGQAQVTAAPAGYSVKDEIVLLSDGMENVNPLYDTPAVRGVIEPSDTIVDTVAVGPSNAGLHALMKHIADDNGGQAYVVTTGSAGTSAAASAATSAVTTASATGVDAYPQTLANRLGDSYKQIAEDVLHENRLFQAAGLPDPTGAPQQWPIDVPDNLPRVTFAVNWAQPSGSMQLVVRDPNGNVYQYDQKNPNCRVDPTHQTCIVDRPIPGKWLMTVITRDNKSEFMAWVSAKTPLAFQLFVATPEDQRVAFEPIHLVGFLTQGGKPLAGKKVIVQIHGPREAGPITLFDDGLHGDGKANDGIYGADFTDGTAEGIYAVRGVAEGIDLDGKPFELLRNTSFHLRPRAAYVYKDDLAKGADYRSLLQSNGIAVDLININNLPVANLQRYNLVVVGPDTGSLNTWGTPQEVSAILRSERPVLGLGEGGYAYFGQVHMAIGWGNGAHGSGTSIRWSLPTDNIWIYSVQFELPKGPLQLYQKPSSRVDIFLGNQPVGLQVFGYNDTDERYADLVMENNRHMLWSFDDGPRAMTDVGRQLFVNTAYRTLR